MMSPVSLMSTSNVSKDRVIACLLYCMYARLHAVEQTSCATDSPQASQDSTVCLHNSTLSTDWVSFATCRYIFAASRKLSPLLALLCCKLVVSPSLCSSSCAQIFGICLFCFVLALLLALGWLLCLFICMSLISQRLQTQQKASAAEPQAGRW